ncbi:MAG: histidine phosphatase family protein [Clostridia bacterium]|nr:histidine phosphatase family protein [Clostridia bacterium]
MLLFFVRHGDPCYDPDSLTPLGLRQAEAIGRRLARYGVGRIFSSPMRRAMQTAQPAAELLCREIIPVDFASEQHAWDELTLHHEDGSRTWAAHDPKTQQLFASPDVRALGMRWYEHPAFAGERYRSGMERIARESRAFLSSLGYEQTEREGIYRAVRENDERVALFAHAGFGGAFLSHVLGIPYPQYVHTFDLCHSSLTVIEFREKNGLCIPRVLTLSNDGHLYSDNLPIRDRPRF